MPFEKCKTADISKDVLYTQGTDAPERRETNVQLSGGGQGDHLIAWEAMIRYWNNMLSNKPLKEVLTTLKQWLISDETADENKVESKIKQKRLLAWDRILAIENEKLNLYQINQYLEEAISLFAEANQASSFAAMNKSSGGQGEGTALEKLVEFNKMKEQEVNPDEVLQESVKLIDFHNKRMKDKSGISLTMKKVAITWYNVIVGLFPKLKEPLIKKLSEKEKEKEEEKYKEKDKINNKLELITTALRVVLEEIEQKTREKV